MTKKSKSFEVAITTETPAVLDLLKQELSNIQAVTESQYKTDGKFQDMPNFNIQTETEVSNLIKAYSVFKFKKQAYEEAAEDLKLANFPVFKLNGHCLESIKHDILLRIAVLEHATRKAELEALIKEGEKFLTEKDQYQMYLNKVKSFTSK